MQREVHREILTALRWFPKYVYEYIAGLVLVILTDVHITTIAITSVILGVVVSDILLGFLTFFVFYTISRIASNIANAIGVGFINLGRSIVNSQ